MMTHRNAQLRFGGRATELPSSRELFDGLAACMVGETVSKPLHISYEVTSGDEVRVETIDVRQVTALEVDPFSERMMVTATDQEFVTHSLHLRRASATSDEIRKNYIEIY